MKAQKLYDCDKVAIEWATHYVCNSPTFVKFSL